MRILALGLLLGWSLSGEVSVASGDDVPRDKRVVVRVFGTPIHLNEITPDPAPERKGDGRPEPRPPSLIAQRAGLLLGKIQVRVLTEYAVRAKLRPSDAEIDALIGDAVRKHSAGRTEEEQRKLSLQAFWIMGASRDWRTAKGLHEKYGGRVAVSSFGACEAPDGRNALFRESVANGELEFLDRELEIAFWEAAKSQRVLDVTLQPENVPRHFAVSPWERWIRELEHPPTAKEPAGGT